MRITYVLPAPEMNGGIKVIFQHASLLREGGHEVTGWERGPGRTGRASTSRIMTTRPGRPTGPRRIW